MLEPVTTNAAITDRRLAYQYTDAFSFPSMNSFAPVKIRIHFGLLSTDPWLVAVLGCWRG